MPFDRGANHIHCMIEENLIYLVCFHHYVWLDTICMTAALSFVIVWVQTYLYNDNHGLVALALSCVINGFFIVYYGVVNNMI